MTTKIKYMHVDKLALVDVQVVQRFHHYILFPKTTIISDCNPMQHILTRELLGGKYSKWIVILQEFDLEFERDKSKKSLVFVELICDFPSADIENVADDSFHDESFFRSFQMIFGMETLSFISKPKISSPIFLV